MAVVSENLAEVAEARGEHAAARAYLEESLPLRLERGQLRPAALVRRRLGRMTLRQGEWGAAAEHFRESLAFCRQDGDARAIADCLEGLGAAAAGQGQRSEGAVRAARWLGAAAARRESRSIVLPPRRRSDLEAVVADVKERLGKEAFAAAWAAGQAAPLDQILAEAQEEAPI
jgi:hypothetical protein